MTDTSILTCKTCLAPRDASQFYIRKDTGKPRSQCKACWCVRTQQWSQTNREKSNSIKRAYHERNKDEILAKRAAYKKANRPLINSQQQAWRAKNAERTRAYSRASYARRPHVMRARSRAWCAANPDKVAAYSREYYQRPDVKARVNQYKRIRLATDSAFSVNHRMRTRLRESLLTAGGKRGRSWEALVGYSSLDLRAHLESQFTGKMGWHNMCDWEIDHILPLASFKIKDAGDAEFMAAWSLANLRPLWRSENRSKGDKLEFLI